MHEKRITQGNRQALSKSVAAIYWHERKYVTSRQGIIFMALVEELSFTKERYHTYYILSLYLSASNALIASDMSIKNYKGYLSFKMFITVVPYNLSLL
jgi:hypothetical protein